MKTHGSRVQMTFDINAPSRRVAGEAVEFLARAAGISDRGCRDLAAAFAAAGRFLGGNGLEGLLHCDLASSNGQVELRVWADPSPARGVSLARSEAFLGKLRMKVHRAEWKVVSGPSPGNRRGRLLIVQEDHSP